MKVLLTGCCGFVGSNLFNAIDCFGVDNLQFGFASNVSKDDWIEKDFAELDQDFLDVFDILVHCATANIIYAQTNVIETYRTNAVKTIELFKKFKGKIVYTSTASVYGQATELPTPETSAIRLSNAYDMSKYIAESFLMQRRNYTTLRLSNVYGVNQRPDHPYSGVIGKFKGAEVLEIYGDGTQTRDYTDVRDVVEAIKKAIELPALNTEVNISGGDEFSVNEIAELLAKPVKYIPSRIIDKIQRRSLDCTKAKYLLGWEAKYKLIEYVL